MAQRKSFTSIPGREELRRILDAEAKRAFPAGKEDKHYPDFEVVIELLERFGVSAELFAEDYRPDDLEDDDLIGKANEMIDQLVEAVLGASLGQAELELFDRVYDYLAEEDKPEKVDLIFVFGAKTPVRIERAAELYKQGLAGRIMVSGACPIYDDKEGCTEAESYRDIAIGAGIPEGDLILEDQAIMMPDNVRRSLNLLDEIGFRFNSIILVNSPYTQRMGWAHFKKYLPDEVEVVRVNSSAGPSFARDSWFRNDDGVRVIVNEFVKMKVAVTLNTA